ncbi:TIGR03016 family PEP-CTERM system-associated outer membrane protein [Geomonas edaphica]|uniref:TIGR03016 family PEP-CTERM system-associated outer membrane protein n=1 Tax=Geomonas edaphica TaxID=2570226 RepID=UPI0010A84206|nr:TIGR03016 family PEP-CTERM system-associated outer membrane protein [Geomonas edaphica]
MSAHLLSWRTGAIACVVLSAFSSAHGAEFRLIPSLTLGEEYNDNLFQTSARQKTDFVTRVQPNLAFAAKGGGFSTDLSYGIDYRYFAKGSRGDGFDHNAAMKGALTFFEDFIHLDLADTYSRVSSNVARDVTGESLVVDQTLQNNALIAPYLTWHLSANSTLKTGYRYRDTRYWSGTGIDKTEHDGYAEWSRELSEGLVLSATYNYARVASATDALERHEAYGGLRYDYGTGNFLYGKAGYNWQSFDSGTSTGDPFWDAGLGRDFRLLTVALGTKVQYNEDPETLSTRNIEHYATISRTFERGMAALNTSYSRYEKQGTVVRDVQKKVFVGASGRYELLSQLMLNLALSGDHLSRAAGTDFAYHLNGGVGLDYALSRQVVVGTNYSYISYRNDLASAAGGANVNRVIVEMRLTR